MTNIISFVPKPKIGSYRETLIAQIEEKENKSRESLLGALDALLDNWESGEKNQVAEFQKEFRRLLVKGLQIEVDPLELHKRVFRMGDIGLRGAKPPINTGLRVIEG